MKYTVRTKKPVQGNKWYTGTGYGGYSTCITNLDNKAWKGSTLNNCVGYAWGRYYEALAQNGKLWEDPKTAFARRTNGNPPVCWVNLNKSAYWRGYITHEPEVGAIAFYSQNKNSSVNGHVSFVEKVYPNGTVDFGNNNSWTKPLWSYQKGKNPVTGFNGYTLLGYLRPCVDKWGWTMTTTARLNHRTGRSLHHTILQVIPLGGKVQVLSFPTDGWIRVRYNGKEGWCKEDYLK